MSGPELDAKSETIRLAEYAEACQACRAYDQLTRTGLTLFMTFTTALLVATQSNVFNDQSKVGLAIAGLIVSMVMLNINFRLRDYYRSYMRTAKKIEKDLGMSLYTDAWKDVQNSWTLSNKVAIGFIFVVSGLYFLGFAVLKSLPLVCAP